MSDLKHKNNSVDFPVFDLKQLKIFAQTSDIKNTSNQNILDNSDIKTWKNYLRKNKKSHEIDLNQDKKINIKNLSTFKNFEQLTKDYNYKYSYETDASINEISQVFGIKNKFNFYQPNLKLNTNVSISKHEKMTMDLIDGTPKTLKNIDYNIKLHDINNNPKTTLMIKNIPNKFTKDLLLRIFNKDFKDKYNYFHLPMDVQNNCNMGYAFINFIKNSDVKEFYTNYNNRKWNYFNSEKICEIKYARYQGFDYYNKNNKKQSVNLDL